MANVSRIAGFEPVNAGAAVGRMNIYAPDGGYQVKASSAIYKGDVVARLDANTGYVTAAAAGAGKEAIGIAAETVHATDTDRRIHVWDDPNMLFKVQAATAAVTDIGNFIDHTAGAGATYNTPAGSLPEHGDKLGYSGHYLASGGNNTAAQFRILGLVETPNNAWGAYAKVVVKFHEHAYSYST